MPKAAAVVFLSCFALVAAALPASAQAAPTGPEERAGLDVQTEQHRAGGSNVQSDPDFLFARPGFTVSARMGFFMPRARSQFHDFAMDRLTLDRGDFRSLAGGVEIGAWLSDRVELTVALDGAGVTADSEYREFVEPTPQGELPIRQTTRLSQGPTFAAGLKLYPMARGESLSRFAWVSHPAAPFVSAGLGGTRYQLEQWGDFVDEDTMDIITQDYRADGAGFIGFLGGGVDVALSPRVALVTEGRYVWGEARMTDDFRQFGPLDLAGFRLTAGLAYRF